MRLVESVGSASDAALAHEAARATVTLLKNAPPFDDDERLHVRKIVEDHLGGVN